MIPERLKAQASKGSQLAAGWLLLLILLAQAIAGLGICVWFAVMDADRAAVATLAGVGVLLLAVFTVYLLIRRREAIEARAEREAQDSGGASAWMPLALEVLRRHPKAATLIAAGAGWWLATQPEARDRLLRTAELLLLQKHLSDDD